MTRASPASSPRLPSPPPMAEDQLGPQSPIASSREDSGKGGFLGSPDSGAGRRIRPGTKAADMAEGPPLVEMTDIDSAFQLTEHLKALHYHLTHPPSTPQITRPLDRSLSMRLAEPPEGVDKHLWLFELCRFLTQHANTIVVALFADSPACSAHTCPEMRASEWQYLCAVHDPPKSCSAIDYCCHTLDWAANTLTSPKNFPSRLALFGSGGEGNNSASTASNPGVQIRHLTNIFRRVYRIFAHAWFSHRDQFWRVENRSGLYVLFKTVCDAYSLIPPDNYTIPDEAEGLDHAGTRDNANEDRLVEDQAPLKPQTLRTDTAEHDPAGNQTLSAGNTTKRHRASPSSSSVSMVIEEAEEEEDESAKKATTSASTGDGAQDSENVEDTAVPEPEAEGGDNSSPPTPATSIPPEIQSQDTAAGDAPAPAEATDDAQEAGEEAGKADAETTVPSGEPEAENQEEAQEQETAESPTQ